MRGGGPDRPDDVLADAVAGLVGVLDVAVATDGGRRRELWAWREEHTTAINALGLPHKLDVTLPSTELAGFVAAVPALVASVAPDAATWCFGHMADGNVHVNVTGVDPDDDRVDEAVFLVVAAHGGLHQRRARHRQGQAPVAAPGRSSPGASPPSARSRRALDPDGTCQPGRPAPSAEAGSGVPGAAALEHVAQHRRGGRS